MNGDELKERKKNLKHQQEGLIGEKIVRDLLRHHGIPHFQADGVLKNNEKYCVAEIKNQEMYTKSLDPDVGDFDGHGLPPYQVKARMEFYEETGTEPYLIILEKGTNIVYMQSIVKLEEGHFFDTKGKRRRRIYPLENFKRLELPDHIFKEYEKLMGEVGNDVRLILSFKGD